MQRRRLKHTTSLEQRLAQEAQRLREQAMSVANYQEREELLRRARQAGPQPTSIDGCPRPGLQPPRWSAPEHIPGFLFDFNHWGARDATGNSPRECSCSAMCHKCVEIDKKIAHFQDIARAILDAQVLRNIDTMIEALEAKKDELHPEQKG